MWLENEVRVLLSDFILKFDIKPGNISLAKIIFEVGLNNQLNVGINQDLARYLILDL